MNESRFLIQPIKSILIVGNQSSKMGGGLAVCEELETRLPELGWTVYLASSKKSRISRIMDMVWTTIRYRRQYSVALVEVFSGPSFIWAEIITLLLKALKKRVILTLYGGNLPNFGKSHSQRVQRLFSSADRVIAPSNYLKEEMKQYCNHITLLRYGVDIDEFQYRHRDNPDPKLITLRSIHEIYNPSLAPKVLYSILDKYPNASLVMIGANKHDGSWEKTKQTISGLGITEKVQMLGRIPRNEIPANLNDADIYLNTPDIDNTPLSIAEAMACGLCIVSTNIGGLPYIMNDGENALLVPADDPETMATAVIRILEERGLASRLSLNARREAEQYSWSIVITKWEELFLQTIQ